MPKTKTDLDLWMKEALASPGSSELSISVPLHVLFGEAVDIARFHKTYWKPEVKDGKVVRRGLEMAASKNKNGNALTAKTGEEILSLQRAAVEAGTRYLLAVDPKKASPFERGQVVLDEITATLEWLFDDGVEDENDARLPGLLAGPPGPRGSGSGLSARSARRPGSMAGLPSGRRGAQGVLFVLSRASPRAKGRRPLS